jgi:hypothetical protein
VTAAAAAATATAAVTTPDPGRPPTSRGALLRNLCLDAYHSSSGANKEPEVSFDIDSTCCFPTSLAVARNGIRMNATATAALNLIASIHFALSTTYLDANQEPTSTTIPIHLLPHYCFGRLVRMDNMVLYICFPELREFDTYHASTFLSTQDQDLWFDSILLPCLSKAVASSSKKQYYLASKRVADQDATAAAAEGFARKFSS